MKANRAEEDGISMGPGKRLVNRLNQALDEGPGKRNCRSHAI